MSDTTRTPEAVTIGAALSAPFPAVDVKWKAQAVKGNKALAVAFLDARLIQDRLDSVVGFENWRDSYQLLPDGSVRCRLSVRIGGRWVTKEDAGNPGKQADGGDRIKASYSNALKRAAVKFGIGRYLYKLPPAWVDYDPAKKQIVRPPQLPEWALPPKPALKPTPEDEHRARLTAAKTLSELEAVWFTVPKSLQPSLAPIKDARKTAVMQAVRV